VTFEQLEMIDKKEGVCVDSRNLGLIALWLLLIKNLDLRFKFVYHPLQATPHPCRLWRLGWLDDVQQVLPKYQNESKRDGFHWEVL
jgi:hypothetical protein